jgi:aldehyde dehydrogenase (NAD+)
VFANSGQVCYAGTRIFVERPVYDEVVEKMSAQAASLVVGNSLDEATEIGPVVSQAQLDRVTGYLESGKREGARTAVGGSRLTDGDLANGYFVSPTVFADVQDDMQIAREEIFGPVAAVLPFDSVDEVTRRANLTSFGLGGGVWTRDVGKAHAMVAAIKTGVVWVNGYGVGDPAMPHGGVKMSGWGREYSSHGLDEYLDIKAVWITTS